MHLTGKKVAILATDGFEQSELVEPIKALQEHGPKQKSFRQRTAKSKDGRTRIGLMR